MEGQRYCELGNKNDSNIFTTSQTPCIDDHQFKEEENEAGGELSAICSQNVPNCLYFARLGRHDILWSVNKLARAVTKWTKSIWQTFGTFDLLHSSHMWRSTTLQIRNCFKTLILQETLKNQNQHQEESCVLSEVTCLCQWVGCARNRLQFHTVLQKLKYCLSVQVYAWTVFPLSLSGIWWFKCFIPYRTKQMDPRESYGETRQQSSSQTCITPSQ